MTREETVKAKYGKDYYSKIGKKGGKAKVKKGVAVLTPEQRSIVMTSAVNARWEKYRALKEAEKK